MKSDKLDRVDIKALAALQQNGRIKNRELAEMIGLSPSACLERVRRLEKQGYIRGYRAILNPDKMGGPVTVFAEITLSEQGKRKQSRFEAAVKHIPQITECFVVSGKIDYLARFTCRDIGEYHKLSEGILQDPEFGVQLIQSQVVMTPVKEFRGYNLDSLMGPD